MYQRGKKKNEISSASVIGLCLIEENIFGIVQLLVVDFEVDEMALIPGKTHPQIFFCSWGGRAHKWCNNLQFTVKGNSVQFYDEVIPPLEQRT